VVQLVSHSVDAYTHQFVSLERIDVKEIQLAIYDVEEVKVLSHGETVLSLGKNS
jgi:hypothetical protein